MTTPYIFNLDVLESKTKGDPEYLVEALRLYTQHKLPKKRSKYARIDLSGGSSYILDPNSLYKDKIDTVYKAQYIRLAGRRSLLQYKIHKIIYLDLSLFPDLNMQQISRNPLLKVIDGTQLHFKYDYIGFYK